MSTEIAPRAPTIEEQVDALALRLDVQQDPQGPIPLDCYRRAFLALCIVLAQDWISSGCLSRYVEVIRRTGGPRVALQATEIFNRLRTSIVHSLMG